MYCAAGFRAKYLIMPVQAVLKLPTVHIHDCSAVPSQSQHHVVIAR